MTASHTVLSEPLEPRLLASSTPAFISATSLGPSEHPIASCMAADAHANLFIARSYDAHGRIAASLSRYDPQGALDWRTTFDAPSLAVTDIAVAPDGSAILTGTFSGTADFQPGPRQTRLTSGGGTDGFLIRIAPNGRLLWANRFGGPHDESGASLALSRNSIYLTGNLEARATGALSLRGAGSFLASFSLSGTLQWAQRYPSAAIATDAAGNLFAAGNFHGVLDVDPSARKHILTSGPALDMFLTRLTPAGHLVWATQWGSARIIPTAMTIDSRSNIYITGAFGGQLDLVTPSRTFHLASPNGDADTMFLARFNSAGQGVWARATTTRPLGGGFGHAITTDPAGNIYLAGEGSGYWIFANMMIQKFAPGGTCLSSAPIQGGGIGQDILTLNGATCILGSIWGQTDLDPTPASFLLNPRQCATILLKLRM